MKKDYVTPTMVCEEFAANEYVAACGEEHKIYKFKCDAPAGGIYAVDSNGKGYEGEFYHPCGKTHEAPVSDVFVEGYVDYNGNRTEDRGEQVIVWLEYNRRGEVKNGHATTNLDMESWETAKS